MPTLRCAWLVPKCTSIGMRSQTVSIGDAWTSAPTVTVGILCIKRVDLEGNRVLG